MKRISRLTLVLPLCASCLLAASDDTTAQPTSGSRLINLSVLTSINSTGDTFTLGYVVGGSGTTGTKPLVIRAAGPSLGVLGVPGTLDDPRVELFAGSVKTGENDNWGGTEGLKAAFSTAGAFTLADASRDAATKVSLPPGGYTVLVSGVGNTTGLVLVEVPAPATTNRS